MLNNEKEEQNGAPSLGG